MRIQTFSSTVPGYRKQVNTEAASWVKMNGIFRKHHIEYVPFTNKLDQLHKGDGIIVKPNILLPVFELKGEETWTGNVFAEIYSNMSLRSKEFPHGRKGWMTHLTLCDVLAMYFRDRDLIYFILMQKLRALDLREYVLVPQRKNEQSNDTYGKKLSLGYLGRRGCLITEEQWLGRIN